MRSRITMNQVKLAADSTCDLSEELVKEYEIAIIPLYVNFIDKSFKDNVDIKPLDLYSRINKVNMLPMTSAPTPGDYINEFKKYINDGKDILYISISSEISSSYQNACIAAKEFPEGRVRVIDSRNLSTGIGLLVLKAGDLLREGKSLDETEETIRESIDKVRTEFVIDTVDYLYKGGRCSGLQMVLSSILKIHPVIRVENGSLRLAEKMRGGREKVLKYLINNAVKNVRSADLTRVFITHSDSDDDALWIKERLQEKNHFKEVLITEAGCVISSHCGPHTVGVLYMDK
jgi:DegV family protein with EDD domain